MPEPEKIHFFEPADRDMRLSAGGDACAPRPNPAEEEDELGRVTEYEYTASSSNRDIKARGNM